MKCKFHPTVTAINHCKTCDINVCEPCSDESIGLHATRARPENHRCFVCKSPMSTAEGVNQIPPFWSRLSEIYRYPLNLEAIITLVIIGLISAFFASVSLVLLLTSVAITLYSFACLRQTAQGDFDAPGLDACFEGSVATVFYVLIVIVAALLSISAISSLLGTGFGILVSVFYICALPAAVIIIAIEESLGPALNPSRLISVIQATGVSYFVMLVFIFIMFSSLFAVASLFVSEGSGFVVAFFSSIVANYYGIVIYHMMGYLVYQNQQSLGYSARGSQDRYSLRSDNKLDKAQLDVLIKSGEYEAAAGLARKVIANPDAPLWDWARAFSLTCIAGSTRQVAETFNKYSFRLQQAGETDKISDSYLTLIRHKPNYKSGDPKLIMLVAKVLFEAGRYREAFNLLRDGNQHLVDPSDKKEALTLAGDSMIALKSKAKTV